MQHQAGTGRAASNPFRFVAETPAGRFDVTVAKGRCAKVGCMPREGGGLVPVVLGTSRVLLVAELVRARAGWAVRAMTAYPAQGDAALPEQDARSLLREALQPVLDAELRRFVERDIVDIYAQRRARDAAIESIQAEIDRRKEKIRVVRREAAKAERELGPAEEALRAELAALDARPAPAFGGPGMEAEDEAPAPAMAM